MGDEIDLGQSEKDCPYPVSDAKVYPSFTYSGEEELGLPEEGEMTVQFRVKREVYTPDRYECTVEILKIIEVAGEEVEAPAKSYDEASGALDKLAALIKSKE